MPASKAGRRSEKHPRRSREMWSESASRWGAAQRRARVREARGCGQRTSDHGRQGVVVQRALSRIAQLLLLLHQTGLVLSTCRTGKHMERALSKGVRGAYLRAGALAG